MGAVGAVGGEALQDAALVVYLGSDNAAGHLQGKGRIQCALVLAEPRQAVLVGGGQKATQELAVPSQNIYGDLGSQGGCQGRGGDLHRFGHNQPVQVAQGNLAQNFVVLGLLVAPNDLQAFAFEVNAAIGVVDAGGGHL